MIAGGERDAVADAATTLDRDAATVNFERQRVDAIIANVRPTMGLIVTMRGDRSINSRREGRITESDFNELLHYTRTFPGRRP